MRIIAAFGVYLYSAAWTGAFAVDDMALLPPGSMAAEFGTTTGDVEIQRLLSDADAARYRKIFALQVDGHWRQADRLIKQLENRMLLGHVQAQRYLHPRKYRSKYKELRVWMADYYDHPQAMRIYRLALRRQPQGWRSPRRPQRGYLSGSGPDLSDLRRPNPKIRDRSATARKIRQNIRRLIRRGWPTGGYKLLQKPATRKALGKFSYAEARAEIAHGYFVFGKDELALSLANKSLDQAGARVAWAHWPAGLAAWRLGRFDEAGRHFKTLARADRLTPWMRSAGAYWASRVDLIRRRPADATLWLVRSATFGATFYGLLARRALGVDVPFDWSLPEIEPATMVDFQAMAGFRRAMALVQLDVHDVAERELRKLYPALPEARRPALMTLSVRYGFAGLAMRIAGILRAAGDRLYYSALFPLPDWKPSADQQIDDALLLGIIRQESQFNPTAKSRRGARGLMQLMPRTAAFIGADRKLRGRNKPMLYDPAVNLALGRRYLRHLLDTSGVGSDLFRLLAAYNAGPGNLAKWQRKVDFRDDPLLFIESIPSRETRDFIETVLTNVWMYRMRLGQPTPSLELVAAGNWPTYRALDQAPVGDTARHARN